MSFSLDTRSGRFDMKCDDYKPLVHVYVDGEFDERDVFEVELHLEGCESCRNLTRHESKMRGQFKASFELDRTPEDLKARLMGRLEAVAKAEAGQAVESLEPSENPSSGQVWILGPLAAAAAAAALLIIFWDAPAQPGFEPIVEESVNWHRKNLPIEVTGPSGDRVKTWLRPKVDFPVRLPKFERTGRQEVSLLGARLSNVRERQAAYVVYEVDGNKVSVMLIDGRRAGNRLKAKVTPAARRHFDSVAPAFYTNNGYNVAVIKDNGVTYSITSELPREDMVQLVDAAFAQ
jgi:anti-sigma factor (TIGR02949 family)